MKRRRDFFFRYAPLPRLKPGFLIIGAQKCGTTSLANWLAQHPSISPPRMKELKFFSRAEEFDKGEKWYFRNFPPRILNGSVNAMSFEATPCLFHPLAPEWVKQVLGPVPKIVLLRDPAERAISHYQHNVRKGREPRGMEEAIFGEIAALRPEGMALGSHLDGFTPIDRAYVAKGLYLPQIDAWLKQHPLSSLLILKSEDMFRDPLASIRSCLDFVGLPHAGLDHIQTEAKNVNPRKAVVPQEVRDRLADFYREPCHELASRFGLTW